MKKFKIGQHIRLKSLPNSNIEIIGISNSGYIYMGDAVVNGSIIGKEQKIIPFEYEDDYEVIDLVEGLESIKPHPNQEWSEEDEKNLEIGIELLNCECSETGIKFRNWLKSLKNRSHV